MDDTEEDGRYTSKHYATNQHSAYNSSYRSNSKRPIRNQSYGSYNEEEDNGFETEELDAENNEFDEDEDEDDDDEEDEYQNQNGFSRVRPKKRRLDSLSSKYEFAPRAGLNLQKSSSSSSNDWTEDDIFVLLEIWGDRFLQLGRKSLRSEDWIEVAEKVSEVCKVERDHIQCRNRLDTLKKKYKKEKAKMEEMGGYYGKWTFFKKMDMLLNASPRQQSGLACGVDSGEYVFMNPRVYLNQSNALDEMRDSPGQSETDDDDDDDSDGLPPKRKGLFHGDDDDDSFRLVADSIHKFGEIYEKIEDNKRQQMLDLEKMRMDFHRDLELQKSQILERGQAEIAKIRQGDDDDDDDHRHHDNDAGDNDNGDSDDASAENLSG